MSRVSCLALISALALALPASAATIYDSGDGTILWTTIGSNGYAAAAEFTFGADVTIGSLDGFIQSQTPGDAFTVDVWNDGGHVGDLIFSESVTSVDGPTWQGADDMNLSLAAGSYWIGFDSSADSGFTGYLWGKAPNPDPIDKFIVRQGNPGPWTNTGGADFGIRIGGTGGEPISGGTGLTGGVGSGVPEPALWALMIGGFGLVGVSLRRTRRLYA